TRKQAPAKARRKAVPKADWDAYKAWARDVKGKPFQGSDKHREVQREYLDEFYRYEIVQSGVTVPVKAQPSYGYSTSSGRYEQKGPQDVIAYVNAP
ncbi:MAG: hypothetical protein Q9196_007374, partial [Gyalolechia fulgens]